jgi:hypothetical protein
VGDDGNFRRGIAGAVVVALLGAANLGLGTEPRLLLGWGVLAFGVAGLCAVVGLERGWFPRHRAAARPVAEPSREPAAGDVHLVPPLSGHGQEQAAGIVAELHAAGVLVPDAPDPSYLHESVADYGEPVTVDAVLAALDEASYYHPGFRLESCTANLVCHGTQVEQGPEYLREQIDDLVRLAGGALTVEVTGIEQEHTDGSRQVPTRIRWTVNGSEAALDYAGAGKYLSTVIHVTLARAMSAAPRRLASLWTDQGMWITALPDGGVERLNAALGSEWEWLADQEPMAAGDVA